MERGERSQFVKLKERLDALDFRPARALGQNFLVDTNLLDAIARDAQLTGGETVIEIGPGPGALTLRLAQYAKNVVAVELDARLITILRENVHDFDNIEIVEGDALGGNVRSLHPMIQKILSRESRGGISTAVVVANLPYSISAPFVANLFEHDPPPARAVVLLQKEVGRRLAAGAGDADYGPLSITAGIHARVRILRNVPPTVFRPRPNVDSVLLELTPRAERPSAALRERLQTIVAALFQQRRKMVGRGLLPFFQNDPARVQAVLRSVGFEPSARAGDLPPAALLQIAENSSA